MRFLIFSPFQAIEQHAFPEAYFANLLKQEGHEVTYAGCDGLLKDFCISQSAYGLTESSTESEKEAVCKRCRTNRAAVEKLHGRFLRLDEFYDRAHEAEITKLAAELEASKIYDTQVRDYPVGQIASYEFILGHKIPDMKHLNPEQLGHFRIHFANTLRVLFAFERLLEQHSFDRVLVYNPAYSINNMVRNVALRHGLPVGFMHAGYNLSRFNDSMVFSWGKTVEFFKGLMDAFTSKRGDRHQLGVDRSRYPMVLGHVRELLRARSVFAYSASKKHSLEEVCAKLLIRPEHKKVVLLSMSSADEGYGVDFAFMNFKYLSSGTRLFKDQLEWVASVIRYFESKPECKLVIRVHPREFPNKREKVRAPVVEEYIKLFSKLPENVVVDYPSLGNSIYDLLELTDLHLAAQSSTGSESALLGIPTVGCVSGIGLYPIDTVNTVPKSPEEYFKVIGELLGGETGYSLEKMQKALDWYLFLHTRATIGFETGNFWARALSRSVWRRAIGKLRRSLGWPRLSFRAYFRGVRIEAAERQRFLDFVVSTQPKELVQFRPGERQAPAQDDWVLGEYLAELFEVLYGVPVRKYASFSYQGQPEDAQCVFRESADLYESRVSTSPTGVLIELPRYGKVARALARMICEQKALLAQSSAQVRAQVGAAGQIDDSGLQALR